MKNILLTGASGFVGRALLQRLAAYDIAITVICRDASRHSLPAQENIHRVIVTDSIFNKDVAWWQAPSKVLIPLFMPPGTSTPWTISPQTRIWSA
ncbi:NAD-dependent epimerase/dehydratase family protein [Erwinia tracheiphila]